MQKQGEGRGPQGRKKEREEGKIIKKRKGKVWMEGRVREGEEEWRGDKKKRKNQGRRRIRRGAAGGERRKENGKKEEEKEEKCRGR